MLQAGPSGSALGHLELREVEFSVATVVAEGGCWWDWGCLFIYAWYDQDWRRRGEEGSSVPETNPFLLHSLWVAV